MDFSAIHSIIASFRNRHSLPTRKLALPEKLVNRGWANSVAPRGDGVEAGSSSPFRRPVLSGEFTRFERPLYSVAHRIARRAISLFP